MTRKELLEDGYLSTEDILNVEASSKYDTICLCGSFRFAYTMKLLYDYFTLIKGSVVLSPLDRVYMPHSLFESSYNMYDSSIKESFVEDKNKLTLNNDAWKAVETNHYAKMRLATRIIIVDCGLIDNRKEIDNNADTENAFRSDIYIGKDTEREIRVAEMLHKRVEYLSSFGTIFFQDLQKFLHEFTSKFYTYNEDLINVNIKNIVEYKENIKSYGINFKEDLKMIRNIYKVINRKNESDQEYFISYPCNEDKGEFKVPIVGDFIQLHIRNMVDHGDALAYTDDIVVHGRLASVSLFNKDTISLTGQDIQGYTFTGKEFKDLGNVKNGLSFIIVNIQVDNMISSDRDTKDCYQPDLNNCIPFVINLTKADQQFLLFRSSNFINVFKNKSLFPFPNEWDERFITIKSTGLDAIE